MVDIITNSKEIKSLDSRLKKRFGDNYYSVVEKDNKPKVEFVSTGCFSLDTVCGSGIPLGKLIEFSGNEASFKTTLCLLIVKSFQEQGYVCAWLDGECCFNPDYATSLGVDVDNLLLISNLYCGEEYIDALRILTKDSSVKLTILDSATSLKPRRIVEGEVGDATMGLQARFWSDHLPEMLPHLANNKCSLILINQIRATMATYGNPNSPTGGNAIKFYKSLALETKKKEVIKEKGSEVAVRIQVKNIKTRVGRPFVTKEITIHFPKFLGDKAGIDIVKDIVEESLEKVIERVNSSTYTWHKFPTNKKGEPNITGKDAVINFFKENSNLVPTLKEELINYNNSNHDNTSEDSQEEDSADQQTA